MKLYTRKEAAAWLGMSLSTFERDVQPHISLVRQTPRLIHVTEEALEQWVAEKQEQPPTQFETATASPKRTRQLAEIDTASRSASRGGMTDAERAKLAKLRKLGTSKSSKAA